MQIYMRFHPIVWAHALLLQNTMESQTLKKITASLEKKKIYTSYVSVYKQYQGVTQIKFNYTKFRVY